MKIVLKTNVEEGLLALLHDPADKKLTSLVKPYRHFVMLSERQNNSPSSRQRATASQSSFTARCFVPETLIDYINDHVEGGLKPASFFIHGVCLLVDISGFTKLSGDFCAQGKDGIDGLQLATNGFMGKLVEIIYSFGGDIIKFAGDAIICIFYSKIRNVKNDPKPVIIQSTSTKPLKVDSNSSKENEPQSPAQGGQPFRALSVKNPFETSADLSDTHFESSSRHRMFLSAPQVQPEIVLKAIRCALELRDVETSKLTVHVAMSCGEMCFGILGGHEKRFECLISGACLAQLSDCLDDAPSKHAALTAGCHDVLRMHSQMQALDSKGSEREYNYLAQVQLERLASGNYMILSAESRDGFSTEYLTQTPRSTPLPALVSHFVPVPISAGMEHTAGLSYLAEIREVTTMFMKWESYDATSEHADLIMLQVYFHQAQKILHTTGAFLRQFLVDDKGCVLIACWGMPSLSYLDNPHRALSAAAQIRNKLSKINMKCSFGITTGDVYCGTVGSALRMEYAAIGNVVNMSARLMSKADEDILIDKETYTRLPDSVQKALETMDPIRVKGREEPLQVYRYSAEGSIFIGDDVVEDHEVREVCKTTFIKLLDSMKAPGRFSVYKRRQSIVKVKDWISDSVRRGGDLLTMSTISNKMNEKDTSRKGMLRSSFQMSFRASSRDNEGSSRQATTPNSVHSSHSTRGQSAKSPPSTLQRRGSGGAYASNRNPGVYQHDDMSHRHIHEIPYVLMEGRRGAGKSSIVNWLKKQATDRQIPVYRARLAKNDVLVDYSLWMKVFRQMMPKDMFKTKVLQEKYVTQLLVELYHNDLDHIEFVAFPSMQRAFGITCELDLIKDKSFDLSSGDIVKPHRSKTKVTSRVVTETLLKVFAHLLNEKPKLIIVENVQFADEESLNVLLGLTHLHTLSAVVLTALGPDGHSGKKALPNGIQRVDSFDSEVPIANAAQPNEWFARFRGSVLFYDHATLITLDDFSPDEIDRMLCEALNLIQVPAEISQLVQDLSGGSFFWVKEIMHFLQEHGRDEFLEAIAGGEINPEGRRSVRKSGIGAGITSPRTSFTTMRIISQAVNFTRRAIISRVVPSSTALAVNGKTTKFKLELLVVCRFEKLPVNVQHVLRTASIIGAVFPSSLLYSVLPSSLQEDVQEYIDALLRQKWIVQDPDDDAQYQFTHPYAHKIIYDLTPLSERSNMHKIIAEHIEHAQGDDPAQFAVLSHHNAHCDPDKAFHYTYQAVNYLLDKGTAHDLGQCVDLLYESIHLCSTVVDADVLRIMVYNVRRRVDELGEVPQNTLANKTAGAIMGGLYGAVSALSSRWKKTSPNSVAVSPLTMIDEGMSGKEGKSSKSSKSSKSGKSSRAMDAAGFNIVATNGPPLTLYSPTSAPLTTIMSTSISNTNSRDEAGFDLLTQDRIVSQVSSNSNPPGQMYSRDDLEDPASPNFVSPRSDFGANDGIASATTPKTKSLKVMVKRVIDGGSAASTPGKLSLSLGGSSSKKERALTNNERAKVYFREKLRQLDAMVDVKVNELTIAGKFGEHKDWQHTLILCTPKKELPQSASPVRFFAKAGSATKQFFAPFFRPSDTQLSVQEHSGRLSTSHHDFSGGSQAVEPGAAHEMSAATANPNTSVSKFEL